jgi:hypothetical protein
MRVIPLLDGRVKSIHVHMHYFADSHLTPTPVVFFKFARIRLECATSLPFSPSTARMFHHESEYLRFVDYGLHT